MNASFEEYVVSRGPVLIRLAWLLTRDEHQAQDVVQDALAKAAGRWPRIERLGAPDAYVRKMVVNEVLSWRRRRHAVPTERLADLPLPGVYGGDPAGEHADRAEVLALLAMLPPQQRAVLVLRYYEGLDDESIAELVGCAPVTVRAHAPTALARLRARATAVKESL
ncbi:MAG TPA: SigE family RNA polymerase sigma factor [Mycobacteriales bacterium]|nr:SigE family RNA polymerase sigma factor [Mycobacteriales bacterium]